MPTPVPTDTPVPSPTYTPPPEPTDTPTALPTDTATPEPTSTPTPVPTDAPTPLRTETPTPVPTDTPTPTATPSPDRPVLEILYKATDGPNWDNNQNWLSDRPISEWYGLETNDDGLVIGLILDANGLSGEIPLDLAKLSEIRRLHLADNTLVGEMPAILSSLRNLEELYLGHNRLSGEIPPSLGDLIGLRALHLVENDLTGGIPAHLGNLTNLEELSLEINQLSGEIPVELGNLKRLTHLWLASNDLTGEIPADIDSLVELEVTHLAMNRFTGPIPVELGNLSRLRILSLWGNELSGPLPEELDQLANLEELSVFFNQLGGEIPIELENLSNLIEFSILDNEFTGCIPDGLKDVPQNDFEETDLEFCGDVGIANDRQALEALYQAADGTNWINNGNWLSDRPLDEWYGLETDEDGRVIGLFFDSNGLAGQIPAEVGQLDQLVRLHLADNQLEGAIPSQLGSLVNLTELFLGHNELVGEIPASLGELTNLEKLFLAENKLTGQIPTELGNLSNIEELSLEHNQLTRKVPVDLGELENLTHLWLATNNLTGQLPSELGNLTQLEVAYLAMNRFNGPLPAELGKLSNLRVLSLWGNQLNGEIPASFGALANLEELSLFQNMLSGDFPPELANLSNLKELSIAGNALSGCLPDELKNVPSNDFANAYLQICSDFEAMQDREVLISLYNATDGPNWENNTNWLTNSLLDEWHGVVTGPNGRVIELKLEANRLSGEIPAEIGNLSELTTLTLWENTLSGEIPPELGNLSKLHALFLDANQLTGEIPEEIGQLQGLNEFWLSGNQINGEIPITLDKLTNLTRLFLNDNLLSGPIPAELGQLKNLVVLNTANNQLTGDIPAELARLSRLEELFINDNQVTGEIPTDLGNLTNLRSFNLSNTGIEGCFPQGLSEVPTITAGDIPVEVCGSRGALAALYRATDGDNWTNNKNWLSDNPIKDWYGIVADDRGHILAINLGTNNLNGVLVPELGDLDKMSVLVLFGNKINGEVPSELGEADALERLFVGGNQLEGCIPTAIEDISDTDLFALGIPLCSNLETDEMASQPSIAVAAFSVAANEVNLTWNHDFDAVTTQVVYRDGEQVGILAVGQRTFSESDLEPNTRYEYRVAAELDDGTVAFSDAETVTLASLPQVVAPIDVSESGFAVSIIDEVNPSHITYRVAVIGQDGRHLSDWGESRCRRFDGLRTNEKYWVELHVKNQDGVATHSAVTWFYESEPRSIDYVYTQSLSGNDDPWARQAIERVSEVYGLTEQALDWMLADIRVAGARDRPSIGGYTGFVEIGYPVGPKILSHELMHGFWSNWNGFAPDCENLNHYTFRRDLAQFLLDFRDYERSGQLNPWEEWEPFYDFLVGITRDNLAPQGEDLWNYLEEMRYPDLWDGLYHIADTEFPTIVAGNLKLIPPPLQPYFEGVIAERREMTWADELRWYSRLAPEDRRLWDNFYFYSSVSYYSPQYVAPDTSAMTRIDEPHRRILVSADQQQLIDFINTLEDIVCEANCEELWNSKYAYWTYELEDHMYRYQLYFDEIGPSTGVELNEENLVALGRALEFIVSDFYCGKSGPQSARESVDAIQEITDLQKAALDQIIDQIADPEERILDGRVACLG